MQIHIAGSNKLYRDIFVRKHDGEWVACEDLQTEDPEMNTPEEDAAIDKTSQNYVQLTEAQRKVVFGLMNGDAILNIDDDGRITISHGD